jgi:hypothetical protein
VQLEPAADEDLFARAMSGMAAAENGGEEEEEEVTSSSSRSKKRPRDSADIEYDAEGRIKERRREGDSGGKSSKSGSSSNSGSKIDLEKFRIPSPPR